MPTTLPTPGYIFLDSGRLGVIAEPAEERRAIAEGGNISQGSRGGAARNITSTEVDASTEALDVAVKSISGLTVEVNLDETNDEVAIYGGVNGSETADAATRQIVNVDATGHVREDLAKVGGNAISVDGGRQQVNATLQVADSDVANGNPVPVSDAGGSLTVDGTVTADQGSPATITNRWPVQLTDGVDRALITGAGELNVLATAQPGTDIGDVTVNNASGASAVNIQDGGNSITVDGSVSVTGPAADGAAVSGNPVRTAGKDASGNTQDIRTDTTGNQGTYDKSTSAAFGDNLSNTQSFPLAEDGSLLVAVPYNYVFDSVLGNWDRLKGNSTGGLMVQGPTAHDAASAGNPLLVGMVAIGHGANPSPAVAAADSTVHYANRHGIPFVIGGHMNTVSWEYNTTAAQTDDNVLAAISTGTKYVITQITVAVSSATTVAVGVRLGFGTSTLTAKGASGADAVTAIIFSHPSIVAGSYLSKGDGTGIIGIGADGAELRITCDAPTSGEITVTVTGYTIES